MTNVVNIRGRRAGTAALAGVTFSDMLQFGVYDVWADGDVSIAVGSLEASTVEPADPGDPEDIATAVAFGMGGPLDMRELTATDGYHITSGNTIAVRIPQDGDVIGFVGAAENVYWHKVD